MYLLSNGGIELLENWLFAKFADVFAQWWQDRTP